MKNPAFICGIVEGFYGRPWTVEQRKELFKRMNKLGLNTYMYAPKDDTKHRTYWRDLYSNEEIDCLTKLIKCAKENDINFYYALSPGLNITFSKSKDIDAIKKKMDQVATFGCTSFALLFDDIDAELSSADKLSFKSFAHAQAHVTNEIYEHLNKPNFMFCPTEYCVCRAVPDVKSSEYLRTLGDLLDPAVAIMWTGPRVVSKTVTRSGLEELKGVLANRNPLILWDNIHANDYDPKRVFLGPFAGRDGDIVVPSTADRTSADCASADRASAGVRRPLDGVLSNPNCEFEANFVAIHTLAQWSDMAVGGRAVKALENGSPVSREIVKEISEISVASDPTVPSTPNDENTNAQTKEVENEAEQKQTITLYDPKEALIRALKDWLPHVNSRTPYLLQVPRCLTTAAPSGDSFPRPQGYDVEVENGDHYDSATSLFSTASSSSSSGSSMSVPGLEPPTSGSGTKVGSGSTSSDSSLPPKFHNELTKLKKTTCKKKQQTTTEEEQRAHQQQHQQPKSFMQRYHAVERSYYVLPSLHMQPVNSLVEKMRDEDLNLDVIENAVAPNVMTDIDTEMFNSNLVDNQHSKEPSGEVVTEPMSVLQNITVDPPSEPTSKETKSAGSERMDCSVPSLEICTPPVAGVIEDREKPLSELQPASTLHLAPSQQHVTVLANLSPTQGLECDMEFERESKGAWDYYKAQAISDAVQAGSISVDKSSTATSQNELGANPKDTLVEPKTGGGLEMKIHYETFEPMQVDNSAARTEPLTPPSTPAPIERENEENAQIFRDFNEGGISKLVEFQAAHNPVTHSSVFEPMDHYGPSIPGRIEPGNNNVDIGGILKQRLSSVNRSASTQNLTLEDALLLSDLFYLPFEHGLKAQKLLDDFHWLKSNALFYNNAPAAPHQKAIWTERCADFERSCDSVIVLCSKLTRVRNKAVLFELFPYVWDLKGVITLVKAFARWLALGAFPQRPLSCPPPIGANSPPTLPPLDNYSNSTNQAPDSGNRKKEPEKNFRAQLSELLTERYSWNAYYGKGFSMVAKSTLATINNFSYGTSISSSNSPETAGIINNTTISPALPHTQTADETPSPPQLENVPSLTDELATEIKIETGGAQSLADKNDKTEAVKGSTIPTPTEPTILRGGLQAEFHRMLPLDTCIDLFCHRPPYPPVRTHYTIRPYRAATDEAPVYQVCRQTFDDGCDSSNLFPNKPDLPGDFLVGGFLTLTPTTCFVLEDESGLCGYILCAPDSKVYLDRLELSWIPELKAKYLTNCPSNRDGTGLVERFLDDYTNDVPTVFKQEPSIPELMDEGSRSSPEPKQPELLDGDSNSTSVQPTFAEEYICGRIKNYKRYLPSKLLQHYPSLVQFAFLPRVDDFSIPKRMLACLMSVIKLYGSSGLYACVPVKHKNEQDFYIKLLGFYELTMLEEYPPEAIVLGRAFY